MPDAYFVLGPIMFCLGILDIWTFAYFPLQNNIFIDKRANMPVLTGNSRSPGNSKYSTGQSFFYEEVSEREISKQNTGVT